LSLIRDLYSRIRDIAIGIGAEGIRFCIVGGTGAIVQIGIQDLLHLMFGMGPLSAETVGIVAGMILTFFGSRYWTFADKRSHGREFIRETYQFFFWAILGWGIQEGIQAATWYGIGLKSGFAYTVVTCFGIGVATVFRFWAYRKFVFINTPAAPVEAESLEPEIAA
jgi:putative flippase GtrA